ncbi:hypothetical protein COCOBI_03-0410 [Coccomyxa sp. Obi]|nr:hypothetical protein COCOBI_03-0410 [Coccomyxa sp. Obi]
MSSQQEASYMVEARDSARERMPPPAGRQSPAEGPSAPIASEIKVMEVDAFCSVHDMIHAAILSYGSQASLREIYRACEQRGRIAYKRSGGSRFITHNDHWKSQIRHALYTGERFVRASEGADCWTVSKPFAKLVPATTKVLIRTNGEGTCVIDEGAEASRKGPPRGSAPRRTTRSKHALDDDPLPVSPRRKRSRTTRAAARFETGSAADDGEMTWRGARGRSLGAGAAAAGAGAAEELSLLHDGSDSVASGAGQHGSPLARPSPDEAFAGPSGFQGSAQGGIEGIDESSQNERLGGPRGSRAAAGGAIRKRSMLSPSPAEDDVETLLAQSSAARAFGPAPAAARPAAGPAASAGCAAGGGGGRGRWGQRLTLAPQRSAWGRKAAEPLADDDAAPEKVLSGSYSPEDGASLRRAVSAEAESPPTTQLYALRSRACPHRSPPGFGTCPDPEAAAAAERAASATQGPIKSRLKAAAKAAAAAEAASAARAAHEEACSTYTDEDAIADEAHTSTAADLRQLRRKSGTATGGPFGGGALNQGGDRGDQLPHMAPRTRSAGAASDARKGGRGRPPMKLIDQVNRTTTFGGTMATTGGTGGSGSAYLIPPTPSMTARYHPPGLASCSTTPAATPSLTPPRTLMSTLQGAASSAAPAKAGQPDTMLLAYGEELPPEDCTEGADESDDGGARRLLRSHAAAAAAAGPNCGFKRAAYQVLQGTSEAMTAKELTQAAIDQGFISTTGKTPELTMASSLYMDIKTKERRSAFTKPEEGKFGLRAWKQ